MNIKGKIVTLRAIEAEDMELLRGMINDPEMEKNIVGWSFPTSKLNQEKWREKVSDDKMNQRYVVELPDGKAVGLVTLYNIDWKNRNAVHGIKLIAKIRRSGIGTDAVMAIMRYAFDELGLHRLESTSLVYNEPSIALYKKCGWSIEGVKKECIYKNGKYRDLNITGIIDSEYYDLIERTHYWDD